MAAIAAVQATNVYEFLQELREQSKSTGEAELNLDRLRLERSAASVVAAGLVGTLGDVPLRVKATHDAVARVVHSGLAFALANRRGSVQLEMAHEQIEKLALPAWKNAWVPASQDAPRGLFAQHGELQPDLFTPDQVGETDIVPSIYERYHAAFINPHLAGLRGEPPPLLYTVRPWLARVLPGAVEQSRAGRWDATQLEDVTVIVEELVENVREHAAPSGGEVKSLVQISIVRSLRGRRLYVSVADNGVGIVRTLRAKLERDRPLPGRNETLMTELFAGHLGHWQRSRGRGLVEVAHRVDRNPGADVFIATDDVRLRYNAGGARRFVALRSRTTFSLAGTVLVVSMPLRARPKHGV